MKSLIKAKPLALHNSSGSYFKKKVHLRLFCTTDGKATVLISLKPLIPETRVLGPSPKKS
jgi:hypothetical protein